MSTAGLAEAGPSSASSMLAAPHHDGSDLCLLEAPNELGELAVVRLRVPRAAGIDSVALRHIRDAEPRVVEATVDEETAAETWWRASFPAWNPETRYRWLLNGGSAPVWLNGRGMARHDVGDDDDFVLDLDRGGPDWHARGVVYQIYPDRFASSGRAVDPPEWAIPRAWDDLPTGRGPTTSREWFGGDLAGVEQRLDHVESLGANTIYLTPVFPAGSTHRYDATTFDRVDPLLGGDEALASLAAAAHARGIRLLTDLTPNHTGIGHEWFARAREDTASRERSFYYFDDELPTGYAAWLGVRSLPKLDWRSQELRERMAAVVRRWLQPPFDLDGWRIDVANMSGRYQEIDVNREVAETLRQALDDARSDGLIVAEHGHDFRRDLRGGGWHGVMNYSGFLRPVWWWLRSDSFDDDPFARAPAVRMDAHQSVETMRAFRAGISWPAVLNSWTLLDSHDTARFRTVVASPERHLVGLGMQMTTPGVPMVFAGDELGLEGDWGEDARRTMPWDRPETWDRELLEEHRALIALRRSSDALARGGIRYAYVDHDVIAYLRETRAERILCLASRAAHDPVRLSLADLGCEELERMHGGEASSDNGDAVLPADGPSFGMWRLR
jgi:alpha-glucosidase